MKQAKPIIALLLSSTLLLSGCGTLTGIPGHGGGKRFTEEQRLVSASIRGSLEDIDVSALRGKRAAMIFSLIADEGAGNIAGGRASLTALLTGGSLLSPVTSQNNAFEIFQLRSTGATQSTTVSAGQSSNVGNVTIVGTNNSTSQNVGSGSSSTTGNTTSTGSNTSTNNGASNTTGSSTGTNSSATNSNTTGTGTTGNSTTNNTSSNNTGSGTSNTTSGSDSSTTTGGTTTNSNSTGTSSTNTSNTGSTTSSGSSTSTGTSTNSSDTGSTTTGSTTSTNASSTDSSSTSTGSSTSDSSSNSTTTDSSVDTTNTSGGNTSDQNSSNNGTSQQNSDQNQTSQGTQESVQVASSTVQEEGDYNDIQYQIEYQGLGEYVNQAVPKSDASLLMSLTRNYFLLNNIEVTTPTDPTADVIVYVTVDVFGINRQRTDVVLYNNEHLSAETAMEMFAMDRNGNVIMSPVVGNSKASYQEDYIFWSGPFNTDIRTQDGNGLLNDFTDQ